MCSSHSNTVSLAFAYPITVPTIHQNKKNNCSYIIHESCNNMIYNKALSVLHVKGECSNSGGPLAAKISKFNDSGSPTGEYYSMV